MTVTFASTRVKAAMYDMDLFLKHQSGNSFKNVLKFLSSNWEEFFTFPEEAIKIASDKRSQTYSQKLNLHSEVQEHTCPSVILAELQK